MTKKALKLALDLAIMHHSDDGYAELRSKVRQLAKEALAQPEQEPDMLTIAYMSGLYEGRKLEREACAKVCENSVEYAGDTLAKAIRARGNT